MMNIIEIGKVIFSLLSTDEKVTEKVKKKIYPLVANADVTFPFIVYKRSGVNIETTKDRYNYKEEAFVEIIIASDKYEESINIASTVIAALKNKKRYQNYNIQNIELQDADEDFIEDTFIQKLRIKIEI